MISIIVAISSNGVIGSGGTMPWHLSEDFAHFKAVTMGHPVIMGRKTYESIGRPLPGRRNIIISRNSELAIEGCEIVGSLDQAVGMFGAQEEVFIIGGGEVYRQAMPMADRLYITRIMKDFEGDTLFPQIGSEWHVVSRECFAKGKNFPYPFEFVNYEK